MYFIKSLTIASSLSLSLIHLSNAFSRAPPTNSLAKRSHYANRLSTTTSTTRINMMIDDPSSHILSTMDFLQSLPTNILADLDTVGSLPTSVDTIQSALTDVVPGASTYSKTSYYTTLGLYVLSFPGIWSQVKRSTKAKTKRKTYVRYAKVGYGLLRQTRIFMVNSSYRTHYSHFFSSSHFFLTYNFISNCSILI